jgi:anti-sigma regulatory factor (Ser/Thr protein kinase)
MSIETMPPNEERIWGFVVTELPNGVMARFVGHNATKPEHVAMLRHKVAGLLTNVKVDPETCFSAELIVSELAANAIENGKRELSEVDVVVLYTPDNKVFEVTISVINPVDENVRLEYRKRKRTIEEMADEESGRGRDITDALTDGKWGWAITELNANEEDDEPRTDLFVVTAARLGATGLDAVSRDDLRHAS